MKKKQAFTLVELLVTVAILGILVALAISNFDFYKQKANDIVAINATKGAMNSLFTAAATGKKFPVTTPGTVINFYGPWGSSQGGSFVGTITYEELLPGFEFSWPTEITLYFSASIDAAGLITMDLESGASHCRGSTTENQTSVFVVDSNTKILRKVTGSSYRGNYYKSRIGLAPNGEECGDDEVPAGLF